MKVSCLKFRSYEELTWMMSALRRFTSISFIFTELLIRLALLVIERRRGLSVIRFVLSPRMVCSSWYWIRINEAATLAPYRGREYLPLWALPLCAKDE
jgi:hypothetical protein